MTQRVLIVDDNPDVLATTRTILTKHGWHVDVASNGQAALKYLETTIPDLVLLDVIMPELSGFDVLDRIRSTPATGRLPVVLVTAKSEGDDLLEGYQHEADLYLTKPCTARELLSAIGTVLRRSEADKPDPSDDEVIA